MTNTNALTASVIKFLSLKGFKVWRFNNLAAPGRKFTGLLGVPDVCGYEKKTGRFIGCEIKSPKDKLSLAQIEFGINTLESGAMWFEVRDIDIFMKQLEYRNSKIWFNNVLYDLRQNRNEQYLHERKRKKKVS